MLLGEFIDAFICKNSLIRLWIPFKGGHKMLVEDDSVCMEWQINRGEVWQSKYINTKVKGVTDIVVNDDYREAINIVLDI